MDSQVALEALHSEKLKGLSRIERLKYAAAWDKSHFIDNAFDEAAIHFEDLNRMFEVFTTASEKVLKLRSKPDYATTHQLMWDIEKHEAQIGRLLLQKWLKFNDAHVELHFDEIINDALNYEKDMASEAHGDYLVTEMGEAS